MSPVVHRIYIGTFILIGLSVLAYLIATGYEYYNLPVEERFYHEDYHSLKPSGMVGHGLGIVGTLMIIGGVSMYMMRKRMKSLRKVGVLKYWLEFHIFLCSVGPLLVLFHTSFKFGGIVSISFWSMVAVVLSGVIGRFIYIQIPRTIQGRELSLSEIQDIKSDIQQSIQGAGLEEEIGVLESQKPDNNRGMISQWLAERTYLSKVRKKLKGKVSERKERKRIMKLVKSELSLTRRIKRLQLMQRLFKYWHVAHLPFALVMLIIMVIHVGVTLALGYKWIF